MRRGDKLRHIESVNRLCEARHLYERRSVSGVMNPNEDIGSLLTLLYDKYGFDNVYVSFRGELHVGKINPNNEYDTPTGLYAYKLSNYITKPLYDKNEFRMAFPYVSFNPYAQFLVVKDDAVILNSTTPTEQLNEYVATLRNKYSKSEGDSISKLCDKWDSGTYYGEGTHDTHKFWLLIFDIAGYINGKPQNIFSSICRNLGIDGFDDDNCGGWIHTSEKCQTVFFKSNIFKDQHELLLRRGTDGFANSKRRRERRDIDVELSDDDVLELLSRGQLSVEKDFDELVSRKDNPKIADYIKKYLTSKQKS